MNEPRLSVIVPVYNGERYLQAALDSIHGQGDPSLEIVVVDDGSTDASPEIALRCPATRYLRQDNQGPAAARNRGVEMARGNLIAFLDADDVWAPGKLVRQLPPLSRDPAIELVTGHVQCQQLRASGEWESFEQPRYLPLFGAAVVRRSVLERVGPLDESLRCAEDVDWFMRARELGIRTEVLPDVVLFYRLHGANLTHTRTPQQAGYTRAVRKLLDRRRSEKSS
jgi:glycosyltransferase involved in cell wall biosynthesis